MATLYQPTTSGWYDCRITIPSIAKTPIYYFKSDPVQNSNGTWEPLVVSGIEGSTVEAPFSGAKKDIRVQIYANDGTDPQDTTPFSQLITFLTGMARGSLGSIAANQLTVVLQRVAGVYGPTSLTLYAVVKEFELHLENNGGHWAEILFWHVSTTPSF